MLVLHIDLTVKQDKEHALKAAFADTFQPAISKQEGFLATQLLRPADDRSEYCLTIAFSSPELQQKWVASDLHQDVWPKIEARCEGFALRKYDEA